MERLARWSYHHRRAMLALWLAVLVGAQVLGHAAGSRSSMDFKLPASDSQRAQDLLRTRFPIQSGATGAIVFSDPSDVRDPDVRGRMEALFASVAAVPHVAEVSSPYAGGAAARQIGRDGTVAFAQIQFDVDHSHLPDASVTRIEDLVGSAQTPSLRIALSGNEFQARPTVGSAEGIGILAAIFILLIAFGSVLAMGLPIMTAVFGIAIGLAGVSLLSHLMSMPTFANELAAMIGIGVGIDYALFIVTRYRQALHAGRTPEASVVEAVGTAGKAVVFAGCTVVISLLGMFLMGLGFVRGLAVGAALAVVVTMIASVTLLPAVLGFVGHRVDTLGLPWTRRSARAGRQSFWFRWSRAIQHRPRRFAALGLAALVALALPVFSIRLGNTDAGNNPPRDTTRRAYDLLARGFGPGFNGPLLVVAEVPAGGPSGALDTLDHALGAAPGVSAVSPPIMGPHGGIAVVQVYPTTGPESAATASLVHRLRHSVIPAAVAGSGLAVHVGGATPAYVDLSAFLGSHLPIFILAVLGLSFLLLLAVFRSFVVPLKAVVMNVLSIGASYGLLVAVFQWGWGAHLLGAGRPGPIESFAPMMMFAILFGLSMDYEVFLLSRIKEEWDRTGDNSTAVADGLSHTARVITAAAAIMVCVFGSFVFGGERVVKEFGLGLAAAILIDATLVRMLLVPATMELLGNRNWWLPAGVARILPDIHIEGRPDEASPVASEPHHREPAGAGVSTS